MADGTMPNLGALVRDGREARAADAASAALAAGLDDDDDRRLAARAPHPRLHALQSASRGSSEPITSDERAVPAIWNMAHRRKATRRRLRHVGHVSAGDR